MRYLASSLLGILGKPLAAGAVLSFGFISCNHEVFQTGIDKPTGSNSQGGGYLVGDVPGGNGGMGGGSGTEVALAGSGGVPTDSVVCTTATLGKVGICGPEAKCTVLDESDGAVGCAPAGTVPAWSKCQHDAECVDGAWCDHLMQVCKPICHSGLPCGKGQCLDALDSALQSAIPGLQTCTAHCHPITGLPCDVSGSVNCVLLSQEFDCGASKDYPEGSPCTLSLDCASGLACLGAATTTCRKWCTPPGTTGGCIASACNSLLPAVYYDNQSYGLCAN